MEPPCSGAVHLSAAGKPCAMAVSISHVRVGEAFEFLPQTGVGEWGNVCFPSSDDANAF